MTETTVTHRATAAAASGARLGDRLKLLRVAAGLTQTELAGDRFSKEYVSQIERGKTRPTVETVEWLAERLNVDPAFLSSGVSTDERGRVEALLARAEALNKGYRYKEAVAAYEEARAPVSATNSVELDVRARSGEAWARIQEGDVRTALDLLNGARVLAEGPVFSDVDRGEVVFRLGVCRYMLSSVSTAVALFDEALALAERGCVIDLTAFPVAEDEDAWPADIALLRYLDADLPPSRVTVSSDAGGCLPVFDADGRVSQMDVGRPSALSETLRRLLASGQPLERVLPAFTSNVARLLLLPSKGRIAAGADADLVVLGTEGEVTDVMAKGQWHIVHGRAAVRGTFERDAR
jgi:transcriptional regulator with XRE-family HTH domain